MHTALLSKPYKFSKKDICTLHLKMATISNSHQFLYKINPGLTMVARYVVFSYNGN